MSAESRSAMRNSARNLIHSVEKSVRVLDVLAEAGGDVAVTDVARALASSASTAHRLLASLARTGMVEQDPQTQRYRLGCHILHLAQAKLEGIDIRTQAMPTMEQLRRLTGETVSLFVPIPDGGLCVHQLQSPHQLRFVSRIGHTFPKGRGAVGRVLAHDALTTIAVEGSAGEVIEGTRALAAPLLDYAGRVRGALALAVPDQRWNEERAAEWAALLRRAAWEVSRRMGWAGVDLD